MTTWRDYKVLPAENNGPPPVGAPENHPANQLNNISREIMSVIRQMGDEFAALLDGIGTMADQDANAVAITGGTIAGVTIGGTGAGLTNLKAQALIEGPIPKAIFPPDTSPLDVKVARATTADTLAGVAAQGLLPINSIVLWYGTAATVPTGWHICDGTGGTPDLRSKFARGAANDAGVGIAGGADQVQPNTAGAGAHSHGGVTGGTAITLAQMPAHTHQQSEGSGADGGAFKEQQGGPKDAQALIGNRTGSEGSGEAHTHTIATQADHEHLVIVPTVPAYVGLHYIMRVS